MFAGDGVGVLVNQVIVTQNSMLGVLYRGTTFHFGGMGCVSLISASHNSLVDVPNFLLSFNVAFILVEDKEVSVFVFWYKIMATCFETTRSTILIIPPRRSLLAKCS
jgi:hypothetical protein